MFLPHPRVKISIVGSLRDREVACSASDRQGSNFESCVWSTVSSHSSHHPQEVLLAQLILYVHKSGLKPDSFHFICFCTIMAISRQGEAQKSGLCPILIQKVYIILLVIHLYLTFFLLSFSVVYDHDSYFIFGFGAGNKMIDPNCYLGNAFKLVLSISHL